ncbi:hypothetical protein D3C86_1771790 [compost metagenome]
MGISTVNTSVEQPAALARSSALRIKPRSRRTYSWNHIGRLMVGATSSIGQTETVERVNGMPLVSAAAAACTSPRRAYIPHRPTGARATGIESVSLNSVVSRLRSDIFFSTRWRSATSDKSSTLRRKVYSEYAPPSI